MIKKWTSTLVISALAATTLTCSDFGVINVRRCFEQSKEGIAAREMFDNLNKEMTESLTKLDNEIKELSEKLNDEDYREGLTDEALSEEEKKFETLLQERDGKHSQFAQQLNQTNMLLGESILDRITRSSQNIAKKRQLKMVLQQESVLYFEDGLDITDEVLKEVDALFTSEEKNKS